MQGSIKTKFEVEDIDDLDSENRRSTNQLEIMDEVNSKQLRLSVILKENLKNFKNKTGNIILNSLNEVKRATSRHSNTDTPVADPMVYSIIGKLHSRSPINHRKESNTDRSLTPRSNQVGHQ